MLICTSQESLNKVNWGVQTLRYCFSIILFDPAIRKHVTCCANTKIQQYTCAKYKAYNPACTSQWIVIFLIEC